MSEDIMELQEMLAELPEITLPDSLTADALWAKMDAGLLSMEDTNPEPTAEQPVQAGNKVLDFARRMRPVLSYAAVFIVMVAVYYGTGMDKAGGYSGMAPAPKAAPQEAQAASSSAAAAAPRTANEQAAAADAAPAQPRMFAADMDAPIPDAGQDASALAESAPGPEELTGTVNAKAVHGLVAVIQVGEQVVLELPLDETENGLIWLPDETGLAVSFELLDGAIRFAQSPCSDQQCVEAGFISRENAMVCCLKDQVLVTLEKR